MKLRPLTCGLLAALAAAPALAGEGLRGEEGLRHEEIRAARGVSRSVFAAQRAERREAEAAGLVELARELRRVRDSLRRLRALETATPRVQVEGEVAPAEIAALEAQRRQRRQARAAPFRSACEDVLTRAEALRGKVSELRSPRQRAVARAALRRLEALAPQLEQAAADAATPGASSLVALAGELGALNDALVAGGSPLPDPTFVTRIHHRREVPRAR